MRLLGRLDDILAAVGAIHDAAISPAGFSTALSAIVRLTASDHGFFLMHDPAGPAAEAIPDGVRPEFMARFSAAVSAGLLPAWRLRIPPGCVALSSSQQPDDEFSQSWFYNEVVRHSGSFYGVVVPLLRTPRRHCWLSAGRRLGDENFGSDDIAALQVLTPHLQTAFEVKRRLGELDLRTARAMSALDQLEQAVILIDGAGRVIFVNAAAEPLFEHPRGLRLSDGGLDAADPHVSAALRRRTGSPPFEAEVADERLRITVAPLPAKPETEWVGLATVPAAMILIDQPSSTRETRRRQLRERFRLTPAEAEFALEIARGEGRQAAAARLGITVATARSHLTSIFGKTGVRRQAALVRLVMDMGRH